MNQRTMQIVGAVAFVAAVGVVAFFIAGRFASGDASSQQVEESADWVDDLRDRLEPTIQADRDLPRARGRFGDFVLVGNEPTDPRPAIPCTPSSDGPVEDVERVEASELYVTEFGDDAEAYDCTDGTIYGVSGFIQHEVDVTEFGHGYFVGEPLVRSNAPAERLELATIEGRPSLIEHGRDLSPFPTQNRIFVIERMPTEQLPGIMLTVYTPEDVDEGIKLAEELIR